MGTARSATTWAIDRELMALAHRCSSRTPPVSISARAAIEDISSTSYAENQTSVGLPVVPVVWASTAGRARSDTKAAGMPRSACLGVGGRSAKVMPGSPMRR